MLTVRIDGIEAVIKTLNGITADLEDTVQAAGEEAAKVILGTEGLQSYPPMTHANQPPTPYYIRGRGMQVGGVRVPEYNTGSSERLGTRWVVDRAGRLNVRIGNAASYAPFVHGLEQAVFMQIHGWRELADVATERERDIQEIYQAWLDRLVRRLA